METKKCSCCGEYKELSEFSKCSTSKSRLQSKCKQCTNKYYREHKDEMDGRMKRYRKEHKEELSKYYSEYYEKNKDKIRAYKKNYDVENAERLSEYHKKYKSERRKSDPIYKLKMQIRHNIGESFKRSEHVKSCKTAEIVGCSLDFLYEHLLNTYKNNYGYDWDGKEKVHVDHIIPLSVAKNEEEIMKLCNYTNLQLLKPSDNLKKGGKI